MNWIQTNVRAIRDITGSEYKDFKSMPERHSMNFIFADTHVLNLFTVAVAKLLLLT
jgi:hypothetical protein